MLLNEIFTLFIVFLANTVEAITGFAGTMLAMPPAMLLIGVNDAKLVLNVVAILVSLILSSQNRGNVNKKEAVRIIVLMLIGMGIGLYLFSVLSTGSLMKGYGVLIFLIALKGLLIRRTFRVPGWLLLLTVLGAGVIHGMFLSGGSLLVIYAIAVLRDKSVIRATLAPVWLTLNTIMLIQDIVFMRFNAHILMLCALCVIPVLLALKLGNAMHKRINQEAFIRLTYVLLIISASSLLV